MLPDAVVQLAPIALFYWGFRARNVFDHAPAAYFVSWADVLGPMSAQSGAESSEPFLSIFVKLGMVGRMVPAMMTQRFGWALKQVLCAISSREPAPAHVMVRFCWPGTYIASEYYHGRPIHNNYRHCKSAESMEPAR